MDLVIFLMVDVWSEFMLATFHLICDDNIMFLHTTLSSNMLLLQSREKNLVVGLKSKTLVHVKVVIL